MKPTVLILINEVSALFCGVFFNSALLYLIQHRTPSLMKSYAIILRLHAAADLLSEFVNFISSTHCVTLNGRFYFFNGGPHSRFFNQYTTSILVRGYLWIVIYIPLTLIPLDFVYRYRAVCHGDLISKRAVGFYVICAYSVSFLLAFPYNGLYLKVGPSEETAKYDYIFEEALGYNHHEVPPYLTMGIRAPLECGILSLVVLVVFLDYGFIVYVVIMIKKKMIENVQRNVSRKAEATQKSVSRVIMIQAMIPLFLCIPTAINILCALFLIDVPYFAPYVFSIISWMAALKPFVTIMLVPTYRCSILRLSNLSDTSELPAGPNYFRKFSSSPLRNSSLRPEVNESPQHNAEVVFFPNY
ncbi:hypothetical protein M3Y94_00866600 [Aphelenchoides besseyi]|nr:hypothetical protein M3Y94_00866600 [Aphelenchoides besseyi]KAI6226690.1 G-PROTEIN-RECEP-F1-2 domain-containing protein [Aphelenchoides besseyi]